MSWGKNVFGYLMWILYTLFTGVVLVCLAGAACTGSGISIYAGGAAALIYLAALGGFVFLLRRLWTEELGKKKTSALPAAEALAAIVLLAVGLLLRFQGMERAGQESIYFEAARIEAGQVIPQAAHGAVFFYLQVLRLVLAFLGNKFSVGVGLQIFLHLTASLLLYFVLRKLAGKMAAIVVLAFCMCAPYMVESSLVLSPTMLFFLLFVLAAAVTVLCGQGRPVWYFFSGIMISIPVYLDVSGLLLLILAAGTAFSYEKKENSPGRKAGSLLLCFLGAAAGFAGCVLADSCLSGKSFQGVAGAWYRLYEPGAFRLPVTGGESGALYWEALILAGLMAFGIFSFWINRQKERMSIYAAGMCLVILGMCFGIFTEEMPGSLLLYLLMTLLAGIGLGGCFPEEGAWETPGIEEVPDARKTPGIEEVSGTEEVTGIEKMSYVQDTGEDVSALETAGEEKKVQFIDNPLPLPKKHQKRVLDYHLEDTGEGEEFDYFVDENDDFDI
ncbi:MAG: hypothetical protein K2O06_08230 [Acetatifactor sp.]|nr:hypothetical protein [Acetatifactor sp.]